MNWFKVKLNNTMAGMQEAIRDDNMRKELMFGWLNVLLALVSLIMTEINFLPKNIP